MHRPCADLQVGVRIIRVIGEGTLGTNAGPIAGLGIHKPSKAVSFGLPDRLSFRPRDHAMVTSDRGQTPTGKASGSGRKPA
jgi:hypothetical protein